MARRFSFPDPRPSKAEPEAQRARKEIEKSAGSFNWVPVALLGMLGIGLAYDISKDVEKYEEKHKKEDEEKEARKRRRRQRDARDGGARGFRSDDDGDYDGDDGYGRDQGRVWDRGYGRYPRDTRDWKEEMQLGYYDDGQGYDSRGAARYREPRWLEEGGPRDGDYFDGYQDDRDYDRASRSMRRERPRTRRHSSGW